MTDNKINWASIITIADLPEKVQDIAECVGVENAVKLAERFGGLSFYLPQIDSFLTAKKEEYIRKNFNGHNHRELALATGYTERWIYEILKRPAANEKQLDLFAATDIKSNES